MFVNNGSEDVVLVRKFKKIVLYIVNFFAIEKAKKSAKDGTGSGGGYQDLTSMVDGNGAGGLDARGGWGCCKSGNRWWWLGGGVVDGKGVTGTK